MPQQRNTIPKPNGASNPRGMRARLPYSLRKLKFDLQKGLTAPELVEAAVGRVVEHLFATEVLTFKYDPNPMLGLEHNEMEKRLRRLLGVNSITIFHDRVVVVMHNTTAQLAAAREILERFYPVLNRADPNQRREWKVIREDPNLPGGQAVVRIQEVTPKLSGADDEPL